MQLRVLKYMKQGKAISYIHKLTYLIEYFDPQKFIKYFQMLYFKLMKLDINRDEKQTKHSYALKELAFYLGVNEKDFDFDTLSTSSSSLYIQ